MSLALVTGGARRLGAAIVEELARSGSDVVVHHHRSRDEAEALAARVRATGARAWTLRADLRDLRAVDRLVPQAARMAGAPVAVLVNNASVFPPLQVGEARWPAVEESLRLHCWAPWALTRALAAQDAPGSVVNVLDATPPEHDLGHFAYQAGKSALAGLTRAMARAFAPRVRVNAVSPGAILPPEGAGPDALAAIATRLPLARHGSPDDVARAVAYLASAPFVTGATLVVDGGAHLLGGVRG